MSSALVLEEWEPPLTMSSLDILLALLSVRLWYHMCVSPLLRSALEPVTALFISEREEDNMQEQEEYSPSHSAIPEAPLHC